MTLPYLLLFLTMGSTLVGRACSLVWLTHFHTSVDLLHRVLWILLFTFLPQAGYFNFCQKESIFHFPAGALHHCHDYVQGLAERSHKTSLVAPSSRLHPLHIRRQKARMYTCANIFRLQNHNNGIPPKYLLDDLKEGGIKKFKTTFQGQDASRLTSHLQDILWNN